MMYYLKYILLKNKYLKDFKKYYNLCKRLYSSKKIFQNISLVEYILNISENTLIYNDDIIFSVMIYNIYKYFSIEELNKFNIDLKILDICKDYYYLNFPDILYSSNYDYKKYKNQLLNSFSRIESLIILFSEVLVIFKYLSKIKNTKFKDNFLKTVKYSIIPLCVQLGMYDFRNKIQSKFIEIKYPKKYKILEKQINKLYPLDKLDYFKNFIINKIPLKCGFKIVDINYRYKSICSIFDNLYIKKKEKDLNSIKDIYAIRFICENRKQCYRCYELLKDKFKVVREKNFIINPKNNNYRSLHLNVLIENYNVEIQIRTKEMHENAEFGLSSHFKYKYENYLSSHDKKLIKIIKDFKNKNNYKDIDACISVVTLNNKIIIVPAGINVFEFAFYLHTDFVKFFKYALVNNKKVGKDYILKNLDNVELVKSSKITIKKEDFKYILINKNIKSFNSIINKLKI
jgi:GTP diphosphokinase / guanosine-3',5'-bis(diphosphate) 3'-diphosphatase